MLPAMSDRVAGPPAYAMVGMAAVLAGSARAPLTAILLMFELTRDYRIVLPLMAAVGLSVWLVECVNRRSTAHSLNLQQMGVDVALNTPIQAREQLQDWEDVLGDRIVTELISCQLPIEGEHRDDEPVLAIANAHLPENVKSLPETKSAV
jgi:hypothetical protein